MDKDQSRTGRLSWRLTLHSVPAWLWFSLLTIVFWGLWGIQSKIIVDRMQPLANQVLFTPGVLLVALIFGIRWREVPCTTTRNRKLGVFFALLTGVLGGTGNIAFFEALKQGPQASIVVPMTALYPMVTVVLALALLKERLNWSQWVGLAMAVTAIIILGG